MLPAVVASPYGSGCTQVHSSLVAASGHSIRAGSNGRVLTRLRVGEEGIREGKHLVSLVELFGGRAGTGGVGGCCVMESDAAMCCLASTFDVWHVANTQCIYLDQCIYH